MTMMLIPSPGDDLEIYWTQFRKVKETILRNLKKGKDKQRQCIVEENDQ